MHDNIKLAEARITRFSRDILMPALYLKRCELDVAVWQAPGEPVSFAEARKAPYAEVRLPYEWGTPWSTVWFRVSGELPRSWPRSPNSHPVEVVIDLGFQGPRPGFQAEGLAYTRDGKIIKGVAPRNAYVPWQDDGGQGVELYIEAAANPDVAGEYDFRPTPLGDISTAPRHKLYTARSAQLAVLDRVVWELTQDVWMLDGLMRTLPSDSPRRHQLRTALTRMVDAVDPDDVAATARLGREVLAEAAAQPAHASSQLVAAVGHAHIDTAWLWPFRETVRKCGRTFANVLSLMDDDPDFLFVCSSAQQLKWAKQHYPELFERIRQRVAEGRFIPVGGMWVEPDMNMPSGESLVRQFLHGQRFFREEFGVECAEAWVPDTFGYSAAIPQIIRGVGMQWFMTLKIAWNQTNVLPHHTFLWEGIDGSRVLTHFPPVNTYLAEVSPAELAYSDANFREKGVSSTAMLPFGWGDGGGGPTREMLAAISRGASLDGLPRVRQMSPSEFFTTAETELADPAVWVGELYLELHRGAYTSQHRIKRGNREAESALHAAELWAATARVRRGSAYPYDQLDAIWEVVLRNQFHDVLPGTSIAWVHREVEESYDQVLRSAREVSETALEQLVGDGDRPLVVNGTPVDLGGVSALSIAESPPAPSSAVVVQRDGILLWLRNEHLDLAIDENGQIVSLTDRVSRRDAIADGQSCRLRLYHDLPNEWDAWDIDEHYRRQEIPVGPARSVELVADTPEGATVRVVRGLGESLAVESYTISAGGRDVEIEFEIDWHEKRKLLKYELPLGIRAGHSTAETQFGHVERATHANTSWEAAKFELCAHRWVHVGEPGFGVAVANDSSYGFDVAREVEDAETVTRLAVSLLRGPTFPDPGGDEGVHRVGLRVRPGADLLDAVGLGYRTNWPSQVRLGAAGVAPLVRSSHPAVLVEAIKFADDRSDDLVVRLYEALGTRSTSEVSFDFELSEVVETDLLERPIGDSYGVVRSIGMTFRPFQIRTFRAKGVVHPLA